MPKREYAAINEASRIHGELIRETRLKLGMTQAELADHFGVWRETISRLECGHFNIIDRFPRNALLNERMRIWAEMNRDSDERKVGVRENLYQNPKRRRIPADVKPRVSARSRYWDPINENMKAERAAKKEKKIERKNIERSVIRV